MATIAFGGNDCTTATNSSMLVTTDGTSTGTVWISPDWDNNYVPGPGVETEVFQRARKEAGGEGEESPFAWLDRRVDEVRKRWRH